MPLSARSVVLALAVAAGPALACPGLNWTAPPYLGELTFSSHNGLHDLSLTSRATGVFNLRDCHLQGKGLDGYRGDGLVRVRPSLLLHWHGEAEELVLGTTFDEDTFLLIRDPDGTWLFDDGVGGHEPLVVIDAPVTGDYAIFLGTHGTTVNSRPGTLIVSETEP